ncbi:MAG: hypothetical protein K5770_14780, partial [Lachnospiraceae bacterium]|nr:hypothetical protein [Lachnospiraceae bacterium]
NEGRARRDGSKIADRNASTQAPYPQNEGRARRGGSKIADRNASAQALYPQNEARARRGGSKIADRNASSQALYPQNEGRASRGERAGDGNRRWQSNTKSPKTPVRNHSQESFYVLERFFYFLI